MKLVLNTDGGSRGNPGPAAAGVVLRTPEGQIVLRKGIFIGRATCNVAEYRGLLAGLQAALELGAQELDVFSDSQLLVFQMTGRYRVKNEALRQLFEDAKVLVGQFRKVKFQHIGRELNDMADGLANLAMDNRKDIVLPADEDLEEPLRQLEAPAATKPPRPAPATPVPVSALAPISSVPREKSASPRKLIVNIDGGSRGNPGPAGAGVVVSADDGSVLFEGGFFLGRATNNVAEYTGLLKGLEVARMLGGSEVLIRSDSELLVKQMKGEYKVKNIDLAALHVKAKELSWQFEAVGFKHIPREQNGAADRLANQAMDERRAVESAEGLP